MLTFWLAWAATAATVLCIRLTSPRRFARSTLGWALTLAMPLLIGGYAFANFVVPLPVWMHLGLLVLVAALMHWMGDLFVDEMRRRRERPSCSTR